MYIRRLKLAMLGFFFYISGMKRKVHLIANAKSGKGKGQELKDNAAEICQRHGFELVSYAITSPEDFTRQSKIAVTAALHTSDIVVAAGGDGTIRGVAQEAFGKDIIFAAIPCGTFNYFARTHRIPENPTEALELALTGQVRPVRLGVINGQIFLINASLGLYAKAISERAANTKRFGRRRLVAIISSLVSMLKRHQQLRVDLVQNGQVRKAKTPMIFIGNNALQLRDLKMDIAACMKQDLMAAVLMHPLSLWEKFRLIFRGIFKTLEHDSRLETFCVEELVIHSDKSFHKVALDGEILHMESPLKIQSLPKILNLVLPP